MQTILFEKKQGIGKITLHRPEVFNSVNRPLALALQAALDECAEDEAVRSVFLTGSGKAFCAGQDLNEVTNPSLNPGFTTILDEHYAPIILKIRNIEKPVVVAVNGVAAGAGANIALACDVVLASERAVFIQAFSKIGLIPDSGGTYFLPRLVGFQKALALAMLGDKLAAAQAERLGLVYAVLPHEGFEEAAWQVASKLAAMPTRALALTKRAFAASLGNSLEEQLALESKLQIEASQTADYAEGVGAFLEKRTPNFIGK
jgi:2-(1,2-epoxy-1,2-dihydrophenyl)acetyl-CoA isomerase